MGWLKKNMAKVLKFKYNLAYSDPKDKNSIYVAPETQNEEPCKTKFQ